MILEKITDFNYKKFIKNKKAVLFLTLSYCPYCRAYKKEILSVIKENPKVKFGCADVEEGNTEKLESEMAMPDYYPTAVFFKNGKEVCRLESRAGDPTTCDELDAAIKKNLK
jgi:thiol-disulfide isomerase/thioredoxin